MNRTTVTTLLILLAMVAGVGVMQLKIQIQERTDSVESLARQIRADKEAIRVLKAEWVHLTSPGVLKEKSRKFLLLESPQAEQIIIDPRAIPFRPKGVVASSRSDDILAHEIERSYSESSQNGATGTDGGAL